jgi:MFS family permease
VVDRVGARRVLFGGIALLGIAALVLASANHYAVLLAGAMLAGLGNSVFHPSDYTLLNQRVSKARIAHAFSVHGISGNFGWAAAPVFLAGIAAFAGWRTALLAASAIPFATLLLLFINREALRADPVPHKSDSGVEGSALGFMRLPAVWMSFGFFFLTAVALGGIQSFSTTSLVALYHVSLASAMTGYTAYMLASAGGMVLGGFLASRTRNHDRTIAASFTLAASLALVLASGAVPGWSTTVLMGLIGLAAGIAGPSRDLLIRAAAPKNATGRVFGVVYSGLDSGLAIGPLLFGALMDGGHPSWVFICIALFQVLAIATAVGVGGRSRAPALQNA